LASPPIPHQYIKRETTCVVTEHLIADPLINRLYSGARENVPLLFKAATSRRMSAILGYLNFDMPFLKKGLNNASRIRAMGIDLTESLDKPQDLTRPASCLSAKSGIGNADPCHGEQTGSFLRPTPA
jgi:phosphatidylserine decarboxylase